MLFSPFGEADCESEVKLLKADYSKVYFDETPFNKPAIEPETYLIIGRRGSGKTALTQYFSFQRTLPNPICIDVDEPFVYQQVLAEIATHTSESREVALPRLQRIWEYVLWSVVFVHTKEHSAIIKDACDETLDEGRGVSHQIHRLIEKLVQAFKDDSRIDDKIDKLLGHAAQEAARAEVLRISASRPIVIAVDTLERYDVNNDALMNAMAALVQCAQAFNLDYRERGVHLKVFMSGEIFPYLVEEVVQNPSKSIKNPVYLLWRPRDLLRLIGWRFHRSLETRPHASHQAREVDWEDHRDVMEKIWKPYFGLELTNHRGRRERSFGYVLRHTQMRPRQLILLCNAIAKKAQAEGRFPNFSEDDIRLAVKAAENELAAEIINSFSSVYPRVSTIVDALMNIPMVFTGNELEKRARQSAAEWPAGTYSSGRFRRLVAELGIVGRVRRRNDVAGYIDADFEYSLPDRLPLTHRDECVVHPMFYRRFNVQFNSGSRVMPFSTDRDLREAVGDEA